MSPIGPIKQLVIHHSASRTSTTFRTIKRWHVEGRGWPDIGYHHVITGDGTIKAGRPMHLSGAHAPPNRGRLGVCVVGDNTVEGRGWTSAQIKALRKYVAAVRQLYPDIEVCGHRDTKQTECPGLEIADLI